MKTLIFKLSIFFIIAGLILTVIFGDSVQENSQKIKIEGKINRVNQLNGAQKLFISPIPEIPIIIFSDSKNSMFEETEPKFKQGDKIIATARLTQYKGKLELVIDEVEIS